MDNLAIIRKIVFSSLDFSMRYLENIEKTFL